MLRCK